MASRDRHGPGTGHEADRPLVDRAAAVGAAPGRLQLVAARVVQHEHRRTVGRGPAVAPPQQAEKHGAESALAVLALAVFLITVDTTSVNVALPTLVLDPGATNSQLQWIVDAYNLVFAALVLAAGSLGDRLGRRGMLMAGLGVFGAASVVASLCQSADQLIAARAAMGLGAAMVYPTTLSILANVFTERGERAKAIGVWAAVSGLGVAFGPITGGWLLERLDWIAVFWFKAPIAALAIVLALRLVPTSRDPRAPRLDLPGIALSTAGLGVVVYTIIEGPVHGWTSAATATGAVAGLALLAAFVA